MEPAGRAVVELREVLRAALHLAEQKKVRPTFQNLGKIKKIELADWVVEFRMKFEVVNREAPW